MSSNNVDISSEIDAIIARAMAEYQDAKGIDVFSTPQVEESPVEEPIPEEPVEEVIPVNSKSVLVEETTSRFSSAIWYQNIQGKSVTLAGLGGIGSYVLFLLSRLKPQSIIMYDDDVVEAANMSGQLYCYSDIGHTKCAAMSTMIANYSEYYDTISFVEKFTAESAPTDIMICGFDNMAARKDFFNVWRKYVLQLTPEERKRCLFIDGRLAAENFQVLCITGNDERAMAEYQSKFLFRDSEAEETICSYKQTTFMANMIGSIMVNLFVNFCANECNPLIPRDVPFYTEYNAETMYFKVIS